MWTYVSLFGNLLVLPVAIFHFNVHVSHYSCKRTIVYGAIVVPIVTVTDHYRGSYINNSRSNAKGQGHWDEPHKTKYYYKCTVSDIIEIIS